MVGGGTDRRGVRHQRRNLGRLPDNKDVCYADEASSTVIRQAYTASINYTRNKNMQMSATAVTVHRGPVSRNPLPNTAS